MMDDYQLSFGELLKKHRRSCDDPQRGGMLTQERLGELLGMELGDSGYSGAAVSDWERDKSKIHEDARRVLIALISVLHKRGGLADPLAANRLLRAGNYRSLNRAEQKQVFGSIFTQSDYLPEISSYETPIVAPPIQEQLSTDRRKQLILLKKVKNFWIKGVLEESINETALLNLTLTSAKYAIEHPWQDVLGQGLIPPADFLPARQAITRAFYSSDRAFLILGEPGAGKTITMLLLAKELIAEAEANLNAQIPVMLNLASWGEQHQPIVNWAVNELTAKYQIPRSLARNWLENDQLILFLDGLDEVSGLLRSRCINALNKYREKHGLAGLVVSCRNEEYFAAGRLLRLGGAVSIVPLSSQQVDEYLTAAGMKLRGLSLAVQREPLLQDMAQTPLMLNIMRLTYEGMSNIPQISTQENARASSEVSTELRTQLFRTYIDRMYLRRSASDDYDQNETQYRLSWLAQKMKRHNRSIFLIEQIQPDWLPNRAWRWYYMLLSGLILGVVGAGIIILFWQLLRHTSPSLPTPLSQEVAALLQIGGERAEILVLILANVFLGLFVALLQGRYFESLKVQQAEQDSRGWRYFRHLASVGILVGLFTIFVFVLLGLPELALIWGTAEVILYVTAARYIFGRSYQNEIRTVESLSWSWPSAAKATIIGLLFASFAEIIGYFLYQAPFTANSFILLGSGGFILGGLRGRRVELKSIPNQGVLLSLRNAFIAATLTSFVLGTIALISHSPIYALITASLSFIIAGSLLGGNNVLKHLLVRSLLWIRGDIPWRYARFLDYSTGLIFLRKVGGGYIFIHQLLQEYMASLSSEQALSKRSHRFSHAQRSNS